MNKNSIIFSITITFVIALVMILISFLILFAGSQKREEHFTNKSNMDASRMFLREYRHRGFSKELEESLQMMNFSVITDARLQNKILNDKNIKELHIEQRGRARVLIKNLKLNGIYYVYIQTPRGSYLLVNNNEIKNHQYTIIFVFLVIFIVFTFLYITTIKKLRPLKTLKDKVQNFGDEEFDISCASDEKDEISLLANEFDKSAKKLKKLQESRNIFIRNIMHELKTPITKGRFLTELPQTQENKEKMQKVFYRLESLINEFASIEELISTKKILKKKEYYLADIIDNAVDLLMCDEEDVIKEFENIKINVDFILFSIAVKNILDNGIKYSQDNRVVIKTQDTKIIFENIGKKLIYPLEAYYEPFFKADSVKSNQSFGLGFYIINNILNANGYKLEYEYEKGINRFIIY
ncbi:ArsS family sensor histidine kinase [Sulfurimonas sp.]|uniref:ArsS family sensor histidine kinase n=1 Tax=Sulfurimonas sp. TaxID=2022749 RepID=UPI0035646EEE